MSSLFIGISSLFNKRKSKFFQILFVMLGILVLALVSGLRDYSIGTDTVNYNLFYNYANTAANLVQYCGSLKHISGVEYGFSIICYFVAKSGLSPHVFYFLCQSLIALNVFLALNIMSRNLSVTLGWMTYCFMFYTSSFNILRQMIALSFILLGIAYMYRNQRIKSILLFAVACLFHNSSIIGILIFLTGYSVMKFKDKKKLVIAIGIITALILLLPKTIGFLNFGGLLSDKYSEYLVGNVKVPILLTGAIRLPMIICMLWCIIHNKENNKRADIFIYLLIVFELIMIPLQNISPAVARLLLVFGIAKVIGYPLIINNMFRKPTLSKIIIQLLFIIYLGLIFYIQVIQNNNGMVYPYIIAVNS
ncbi:EpsG family protein [Limosilactobacillus frumenti]|nr:EpsG family protein [Limosilactobacillus frumenti]